MSKKRKPYTSEFQAKLVLEVLKDDKTLNGIASIYNVMPKNLHNRKNKFFKNAEIAMDLGKAIKEYKDKIKDKDNKIEELWKQLGLKAILAAKHIDTVLEGNRDLEKNCLDKIGRASCRERV